MSGGAIAIELLQVAITEDLKIAAVDGESADINTESGRQFHS